MSDTSSSSAYSSASSSRSSRSPDTGGVSILDAHDIDEVSVDVFDQVFHGFTIKDTFGRPFELNQHVLTAVSRIGQAKDMVATTCNVLNRIVHIYQSFCNPSRVARVKFVQHSQAVLLHHPHKSDVTPAKPHIIAVPEPMASSYNRDVKAWSKCRSTMEPPAIAWHHILAAVLVNATSDEQLPVNMMVDLLGPLHQARPDLPGCFAVTATRDGCRLWWSDAASFYTTPRLAWEDPATATRLLNFVYRLHHPLATDSTIKLESLVQCPLDYDKKPVWHVGDGLGGVYRVEHIIAVGEPWTRKNWVAVSTEYRSSDAPSFAPCSRVIIKDSSPLIDNEAFVEDAILDHIHGAGLIAGVCSPISSFVVANDDGDVRNVEVPDCSIAPRRKHRLVMRGDGEDIYQCPSVLRFVMMMYDILEVLRYIHEHRGVLHRDISMRNVLHAHPSATCVSLPGCKFASEVLAHKYPQMAASSGPACTLIDFDIAFCKGRSPESAAQECGTPTFMARNVVRNFRISSSAEAPRFPKLDGSSLDCYIHAFGQQRYDDLSALLESTKSKRGAALRERGVHRPHHDAESCYWLTVHFLSTALPRGADRNNDNTADAKDIIELLEDTYFGRIWDPRVNIMELLPTEWAPYLHPDLASVGTLLSRLGQAVRPIYDIFEPSPPPYHLHEAMQRILLQEACRLLDQGPLPLNTVERRSFYSHFNILPTALQPQVPPQPAPASSSRKRPAEDFDEGEGAGSRPRLDI